MCFYPLRYVRVKTLGESLTLTYGVLIITQTNSSSWLSSNTGVSIFQKATLNAEAFCSLMDLKIIAVARNSLLIVRHVEFIFSSLHSV